MSNKVYLYNDNIGSIELVQHMGEDITVVNSARVSFGVEKEEIDEKDEKLINYLVKHKHTSTLEHNIATFRIKVPLFIRSQHHRHRTWSYNEISRRYTNFNLEFYEPESFRTQHKSNRQASSNELVNPEITIIEKGEKTIELSASDLVKSHHLNSLKYYSQLVNSGVCKEQARGILPQNIYTEYYATANLSNILKFIDLRMHEGAQWEIQLLAKSMLDIVTELWPITVGAYRNNKK